MEPLYSVDAVHVLTGKSPMALLYFSNDSCSVCKVLKPRVVELLKESFPGLGSGYVDTEKSPLIAGQFRVFTIPTILLFLEGKEHARYSRNLSMHQLEEDIARPYSILY
jgi:thioredoxin-like negative regulator of GroEL